MHCGDYTAASAQLSEVVILADEKGAAFWKTPGRTVQGWLFALTGKAPDAVQMITFGINALRMS
jgi:hypothetical protein